MGSTSAGPDEGSQGVLSGYFFYEKRRKPTVKMKLSIAIAVLMLVFAAHTEAQEAQTIEERFSKFSDQLKEMSDDMTVKTQDLMKKIGDSEFITKTRGWFNDQIDKLKTKIDEGFPGQ
ncbi:hypothetical protein UPYG_G00152160 [Umbra pygmaea]|uniref:Apolipoprotein C-I n=1 Tax=Umbra pygmaea TaxID=75934 RepID=A0ABD0WX80_UMBPY